MNITIHYLEVSLVEVEVYSFFRHSRRGGDVSNTERRKIP